jgi:hypothetical protein
MSRIEFYIEELSKVKDWKTYLLINSNLPGPRGNLELMQAFMETGSEEDFIPLLDYTPDKAPVNSPEEFLAFCGTVGLGKLISQGQYKYFDKLREQASDPRWRTREAVAWALQLIGKKDFGLLLENIDPWITGNDLEKRAVAAGLCEPVLLKNSQDSATVIEIIDRITRLSIINKNTRSEEFQVLRKGLGYCWSVAMAANPAKGKPAFEKLLNINDPDIRWIIKENLKKNRLLKMDPEWVADMQKKIMHETI